MSGFVIGDLPARMQSKVVLDRGCWVWIGARNKAGYGSTSAGKRNKSMLAHRRSYEALVGPIPEGLEIDHLCFNTSCINPEHLEPVTSAENQRRKRDRYKVDPTPEQVAAQERYMADMQDIMSGFIAKIRRNQEIVALLPDDLREEREARRHALHVAIGCSCVREEVSA